MFVCCTAGGLSQSPSPPVSPAAELAGKIVSATGPHATLSFSFTDRSTLGAAQAMALSRAVQQALQAAGATLSAGGPDAVAVAVTLSESWRYRLLIAQVQPGPKQRVVMVRLPRGEPGSGALAGTSQGIALTRRLVFSQNQPFLSFFEWPSPADHFIYLWVLEPGRLTLARRSATQNEWQSLGEARIATMQPRPRDPRGILFLQPIATVIGGVPPPEWLLLNLPGIQCTLKLMDAGGRQVQLVLPNGQLPLTCRPSSAPNAGFPIFEGPEPAATATLVPGRNFFDGSIQSQNSLQRLPPFYSAAIVQDDRGQAVLVATGVDGQAVLYDSAGNRTGTIDGWGSDIVAIPSACPPGWQVVADGTGDWMQNDAVIAYEIVEGKAVAVSEPLEFPGPVMALAAAPVGPGARAVVRDLRTGFYEAYSITVSCGQ